MWKLRIAIPVIALLAVSFPASEPLAQTCRRTCQDGEVRDDEGCCHKKSRRKRGGLHAAALQRMPRDLYFVLAVDVAGIRRSVPFRETKKLLERNPEVSAFVERLRRRSGIDVFRHLDGVWIGMAVRSLDDPYVLTRWRQGRRVLEEALSKLGAERSGEHYEVDSRNALAVLDGGWIALGPKSQIREISSRGATKARNRALRPAVRAARTRADVWAAAVLPAEGREELRREPETKELASMELAIGSASVGRRISLRGRLQFSDPASGSRAAALMKTALRELAAERDIKRAGFDQVLSGASIRARGRSVRLSARMSNEQLRALLSYLVGSAF